VNLRPGNCAPLAPLVTPLFAWIRKGYGNPDGVSFWLGLHFLRPAQFLAELVHPNGKNQLRPSTPCATVWIILQTTPSIALLVTFSHGPFISLNVSLMLACLGTPDLITVVVFFWCPGKLFTMKMQMQYFPYRQ